MYGLKCGLISVLFGMFLLTGCGSQAGNSPTASQQLVQDRGQPDAEQCERGQEQWRAPGPPKRGGVFRASGAGPNLAIIEPGSSTQNARRVYDGLVTWRGCFYEDVEIAPSLARSWEASADGRQWTFHLRDGVRWHNKPPVNGRPFSAADVAWTVDYQQQGGILKSYWNGVTHQEPDGSTIVLRLPEPDADFLPKLADTFNVVVPREIQEQFKTFKTSAIGTGPFMVKDFKPDEVVVLQANPAYYETGTDGRPLPYVDEFHSIRFGDEASEVAAIRSAQLDLNTGSGFRQVTADQLRSSAPAIRSYQPIGATIFGLFPDVRKKPFDDPRVRKAISLAIDRTDLIEGSLQGSAVYSGFVAAPLREYAWSQEKMSDKFKPDPARAKQMLADAGYGQGQARFVLTTVQNYVPDAEVVQRQLRDAGVDVQINVSPVAGSGTVLRQGGFEAVFGAITSPPFLVSYQVGEMVRSGGAGNFIGFSDPKVDRLAEAQGRELNPAKRQQTVAELQDYLYDVMPYVPVYTKRYHRFVSCRTQNFPPIHFEIYGPAPEYLWLDDARCPN